MKKKIIIGSIIAVVILALVAVNVIKSKNATSAFAGSGKTVTAKTVKISKGSISSSISASGTVEEIDKAEVYFDTALRVKKIFSILLTIVCDSTICCKSGFYS